MSQPGTRWMPTVRHWPSRLAPLAPLAVLGFPIVHLSGQGSLRDCTSLVPGHLG